MVGRGVIGGLRTTSDFTSGVPSVETFLVTRRGVGLVIGDPNSGSFANDACEEESQIGAIRSGDGFRNGDPKVGSLARNACDGDTQFRGEDIHEGEGENMDDRGLGTSCSFLGVGVGVDMGDVLPDMKNDSPRCCSSNSSSLKILLDSKSELEAAV